MIQVVITSQFLEIVAINKTLKLKLLYSISNSLSLAFHHFLYSVFNVLVRLSPLVGLSGLEPPTSRLSGVRSNRLSYKPISRSGPFAPGGDERDRTDDPLLAKQVLSQLSYTPIFNS